MAEEEKPLSNGKGMRSDSISRIGYKTTKVVVTKANLGDFFILMNRRDIRWGKVKSMVTELRAGNHFEVPWLTNLCNNKHRLIDGNHRYEAVKAYIEAFPDRKVEVTLHYYEDLSTQEEREEYTKWNKGTKQNTNDFVKQYWSAIPIIKLMQTSFPCKISHVWSGNAIEFSLLTKPHLARNAENYQGTFSGSAEEFIIEVKKLGTGDYQLLKSFMSEFIQAFGVPSRQNMHYKPLNFAVLYKLWYDNRKVITFVDMQKVFARLRNSPLIVQFSTVSGREQAVTLRQQLLLAVNRTRTKNPLV